MNILFWSGGKDAYLALEFYRREHPHQPVKLLTTYNEDTGIVPYQKISLERIEKQAETLGLELVTVGLPENCPNDIYIKRVSDILENMEEGVTSLIFGDWKLEDIRKWREKVFRERGWNCLFPIWNKSLHDLLPVLLLKPVEIKITAVESRYRKYIKPGETYTQGFIRQLPSGIDPMGENGEFHTEVIFENPYP